MAWAKLNLTKEFLTLSETHKPRGQALHFYALKWIVLALAQKMWPVPLV
jgi:hypothetical protein